MDTLYRKPSLIPFQRKMHNSRRQSWQLVVALACVVSFPARAQQSPGSVAGAQQNVSAQAGAAGSTDPLSGMSAEQTLASLQSITAPASTLSALGTAEYNDRLAVQNGSMILTSLAHYENTGRTVHNVSTAALKDLDWNAVVAKLYDRYYHLEVSCKRVDAYGPALTNCVSVTSDNRGPDNSVTHREYPYGSLALFFPDADSTVRAAQAIKHLIALDGTSRGVVVGAPPPPPEDFTKGPLPDVLAILKTAATQKIVLSKDDYRKLTDDAPEQVKKANNNDYAERGGGVKGAPTAATFAHSSEAALGVNDPRIELAYQRACALPYNDAYYVNFCADLGKYYERRGDRRMALAVYTTAPKCQNETHFNARLGPPCLSGAARLYDMAGDQADAARSYGELCNTYSVSCEDFNRLGGHADLMAAEVQRQANIQDDKAQRQQEMEDRAERTRAGDARFNAVLGALQGMPNAGNPNAIVDAGNQQAAAIGAAAMRQQQARLTIQNSAPSINAASSAQPSTSANLPGNPPPSGSTNSVNGSGTTSESSGVAVTYLTPLPASCVRQYYDPATYNWLAFENDCGQPVYIEFIFQHNVGWAMTGAWTLQPGAHENSGRSGSDIGAAGGLDLYVCPAGSIPVDLNGNALSAQVSQYRCKPQ
jgi:hypothetical protein